MTAEQAKPKRPKRPLKLLRALDAAQREALEIPAGTTKTRVDGAKTVEATYAGSDDALRTARALLHRHGLMADVVSSRLRTEGTRLVLVLEVEVLHLDSGQELLRTYEGEVSEAWGSSAASISTLATGLRMLLLLPREPEHVVVSPPPGPPLPTEPDDLPRETQRVVIPAPVLPKLQAEMHLAEAKAVVRQLVEELARHVPPDHQAWRRAAAVPISGPMSVAELRKYAEHLRSEIAKHVKPPDDSSNAWAHVDESGSRPVLVLTEEPAEVQHGEG